MAWQVSHMTSSLVVLSVQGNKGNEENEVSFHFICKSTPTRAYHNSNEKQTHVSDQLNTVKYTNGIHQTPGLRSRKFPPNISIKVKRLTYLISFCFCSMFVQISHSRRLFRGIYHPFVSILNKPRCKSVKTHNSTLNPSAPTTAYEIHTDCAGALPAYTFPGPG